MDSKIEWTDHTWNPITGCTKTSEGCRNCYAENMAKRFRGQDGFKLTLHPEKLDIPLMRKKPTTYFVCSMSDLFHEDVPFEFIEKIFNTMVESPQHTFQVLTKRPERMAQFFAWWNWFDGEWSGKEKYLALSHDKPFFPNIWLGVTAENQKEASHRIPILLAMPTALRFISVEPMLEAIDLNDVALLRDTDSCLVHCPTCRRVYEMKNSDLLCLKCGSAFITELPQIDWVICGGESGQRARPLNPLWVKNLQEQCSQANVPFFFKQWGEFTCRNGDIIRVGKKEAGYLIDGKECREMPAKR